MYWNKKKKENWFFLSLARGEIYAHLTLSMKEFSFAWLYLLHTVLKVLNSYVQLPHGVQKTCSHPQFMAFTIFLIPIPKWDKG